MNSLIEVRAVHYLCALYLAFALQYEEKITRKTSVSVAEKFQPDKIHDINMGTFHR